MYDTIMPSACSSNVHTKEQLLRVPTEVLLHGKGAANERAIHHAQLPPLDFHLVDTLLYGKVVSMHPQYRACFYRVPRVRGQ